MKFKVFFENDEQFVQAIKQLNEKGGSIYRILFLKSNEKLNLNPKSWGQHWTIMDDLSKIETELFQLHIDDEEYGNDTFAEEDWYSYHIQAYVPPNNIDTQSSINNYIQWEKEVYPINANLIRPQKIIRYKINTKGMPWGHSILSTAQRVM